MLNVAVVRIYDRLFNEENPGAMDDFMQAINPNSFIEMTNARIEPDLAKVSAETAVQFTRVGYFCADQSDHSPEKPVFNRVVALRDVWQKKA